MPHPPTRPEPLDRRLVVLGGGLAGLSAAYHLGGADLYEAAPILGGLAASRRIDGYTFDYTGHLPHFRTPYVRELVGGLLDEELELHSRKAWIHLDGNRIKYPFQANLHDLPEDVRRECLDTFVEAADRSPKPRSRNFREWIENHFGAGIARHFMVPYNEKLWQVPLDQMSSAWIDSLVPQPDRDEVIQGAAGPPPREFGYNIQFAYPRHGGIGRLAQAFAPHVGQVHVESRATRVDPVRRQVHFADGRAVDYETLVSSIPLPILLRLLDPCPPEVAALADRLVWNSIVNLNLGVDGAIDPEVHWIYFPEPEYQFYRVGVASNFSPSSAPPGKSSLYVEVSFRGACPYEKEPLVARVGDDLVRAGLLGGAGQIELVDYNVLPFAYVVYDLHYGETTRAAHEYLESVGVHSIGRFGAWRYYSMEQTILDGKACAEKIRSEIAAG